MYKSEYLNRLLDEVKAKYGNEKEFVSAVEEFFDSMDFLVDKDPKIEQYSILERLIVPERVIQMRVPWVDDSGKIRVNTGYRVQFNSAIGPYKGGADFDPRGKSDGEVMRFCQSFMSELYRHIGPDTDVPAGDLGFGAREVGYMFGYYKKLRDEWSGVFTGKGLSYGGSLARPEATGYGLLYYAREMLKTYFNTDFKGKRVIISGCGKVGGMAAEKANQLGAILVGMSDIDGYVSDPNGLDVPYIVELSKQKGMFSKEYASTHKGAKFVEGPRGLWSTPCDIALPCATQGEISLKEAEILKKNGCYMVVEGANMPTDVEAIRYFNSNDVLFAPGKASNAGGVAVSGLEMSQNAMHLSWTFEEVDQKLEEIMKKIFKACHDTAVKYNQPRNLALGANIAGFLKVYDAMLAQGVC